MAKRVVAWEDVLLKRLRTEIAVQCVVNIPANQTEIRIFNRDVVNDGRIILLEYRSHPIIPTLAFHRGELLYDAGNDRWWSLDVVRRPYCTITNHFKLYGDQETSIVGQSFTLKELETMKVTAKGFSSDVAYRHLLDSSLEMSINSPQLIAHYGRLYERIRCELMTAPPQLAIPPKLRRFF